MKKTFWIFLSIVVAIIIAADLFLIVSGSLEEFPTAEQSEKVEIAYGFIFVFLMIVEVFLLTRILRNKQLPPTD